MNLPPYTKTTWVNNNPTPPIDATNLQNIEDQIEALTTETTSSAYIPDYTESDQGVTGGGKTVKDYVDTIGSDRATLIFRHTAGGATTSYVFSTNETIPSNIAVVIENGAVLTIGAGVTVTINGAFGAGLYQVFNRDGTVNFAANIINTVYPQWWGASPSSSAAINTAAFNLACKEPRVLIPDGEYNLNALDTIDHPICIEGTSLNTVLIFDTTLECFKFTLTTPAYPYNEGVIMGKIRFDSITNVPASFITIDRSVDTQLEYLQFIATKATVGILNNSTYGLELHRCRWNHFYGTALKLMDNGISPNYSYAINLFNCDFSNNSGIAIDQQGGDLKIFGGVIESSDPTGMVKISTNNFSSTILFSGVYFEGTNSCFILAPTTTTHWPLSVSMIGCNLTGAGCWIDIGAKGMWNITGVSAGGSGIVMFKATNNTKSKSPRAVFNQCVVENFIFDSTLTNDYTIIGKNELLKGDLRITGNLQHDKFYWSEEFADDKRGTNLASTLKAATWTLGGTNYSAGNVYTYYSPSLKIITSSATNDSITAMYGDRFTNPTKNSVFESRFQTTEITAKYILIGLTSAAFVAKGTPSTDFIGVGIDTDNTHGYGVNQLILTSNNAGAGIIIDDLGISVTAAQMYKFKIDLADPNQPRIWVDDIEIDSTLITGTVASTWFNPYIITQTLESVSKIIYVDYLRVWHDRTNA